MIATESLEKWIAITARISEDSINVFPGKEIEGRVDGDDYRLLVVANKYLMGFDQNSDLALKKLIANAVSKERRRELELYGSYAHDAELKRAFDASIARLLARGVGAPSQSTPEGSV